MKVAGTWNETMATSLRDLSKEVERQIFFTDVPDGEAMKPTKVEVREEEEETTTPTTILATSFRDLSKDVVEPVVKEVERQIFFTDIPAGVMKSTLLEKEDDKTARTITSDGSHSNHRQLEEAGCWSQSFSEVLGSIERVLCFADLKDIDESEKKKIVAALLSQHELELQETVDKQNEDKVPDVEAADSASLLSELSGDPDDFMLATEESREVVRAASMQSRAAGKSPFLLNFLKSKSGFLSSRKMSSDRSKSSKTSKKSTKSQNENKRKSWGMFRKSKSDKNQQ